MSTYCMVALAVFTLGCDRLSLNPSSLLLSSSSVTHSTTDFEGSLSLDSILAARERDVSVAVETRRSSIPWLTMYTLLSLQLIWQAYHLRTSVKNVIKCMQEYYKSQVGHCVHTGTVVRLPTQPLYKHMYICTDNRLTQTLYKHVYRQQTYTATATSDSSRVGLNAME